MILAPCPFLPQACKRNPTLLAGTAKTAAISSNDCAAPQKSRLSRRRPWCTTLPC